MPLQTNDRRRKLILAGSIAIGFSILLLIIANFLSYRGAVDQRIGADWFVEALKEDRKSLLIGDAFRAVIFSLLIAAALFGWMKGKLQLQYLLAGIAVLISIDVLALNKRFVKDSAFVAPRRANAINPTEADQLIMQNSKPGERVLNLQNPFNESETSYFHESIGGYHGAKMRRYQDLVEVHLSLELNQAINAIQNQNLNFSGLNALNMLNAKYLKFGDTRQNVVINRQALGNAWLVNELIPVNSADEAIEQINSIDPKRQAIINKADFEVNQTNYTGSGNIELLEKTPNNLKYEATISGGESLVVFSEIYYPKGWIAKVDNEEVPIYRVNYLLRAIEIPEGKHEVTMTFQPDSYYIGGIVTTIFNVLLLLGFVGVIGIELKKQF
jgi:hypothetical protein